MTTALITWFLVAFVISFLGSILVKHIAKKLKILDRPSHAKNIHKKAIPLLGGIAIFVSILITILILLNTGESITGGEITQRHYFGFLLGGLILMIGGYLDDRYKLPPKFAIVAPILAALSAIGFGIEVDKLTNPFGGIIYLESWQSDILVFVWLMIVMYTTKFLDGLDGLATGISAIGAFMIMLLSLTVAFYQPDVALLSALSLGALLGFLLWNVHPASIFLGEGGSTFVGFLVGTLAVISGGKLATALLVLGIPFLDVIWVVIRRFSKGGVKRVFKGDRKHLHHRLLDLGWSQRRIVLTYFVIAGTFGVIALFLQSREKLVALVILVLIMIITATLIVRKEKEQHART